MLEPPECLETARLCLRWPVAADAGRIFAAWGADAEVTRYLAWRPHGSLEQAEARMAQRLRDLAAGSELSWIVTPREDPERVLGMASLFPADHRVELGYVLARRHRGQGYMPEAALLEKIGMQQEGVLRRFGLHPNVSPEPRDCLLFARVR